MEEIYGNVNASAKKKTVLFPFESSLSYSKIITGGNPVANLDNSNNSALKTVQASREFTTENGCHMRIFYRKEHDPSIRREIARLLLIAFEQERNVDDETSHVSVQSIDQRTGRQTG